MLTTIKGTYENGQITLAEKPISNQKVNVIVTFLDEETIKKNPNKNRKAGGLSGKVWMSEDFNEPLEDLKDYM
ncbi:MULTISPECIES: DUF2281 domain-containing protein [unclassified Arcicella]|uniref:DUF2281 domain-containing protein n=1 Tax=unclassified Arcicella TaxID=2644986 RepID=UPI002865AF67|nr:MULTISPECIES: DUF2281 domain-containing protein [unclassified Arcicella]MDR6560307.1 hypothetical protein [Arcicella sp. BE51]MDR6810087.1 hypothetical protein [Arcicella sp. BE140]MDR6821436.1 hypothetical protein [Arcicella sp. BE139]